MYMSIENPLMMAHDCKRTNNQFFCKALRDSIVASSDIKLCILFLFIVLSAANVCQYDNQAKSSTYLVSCTVRKTLTGWQGQSLWLAW